MRSKRQSRSSTPANKPTDYGPAWVTAEQALAMVRDAIDDGTSAEALLAATIRNGRVRAFSRICRTNLSDDWGVEVLTADQAEKHGYANRDWLGPSSGKYGITPNFWALSQNPQGDLEKWDWAAGELIVGRVGPNGEEQTSYWELFQVLIPIMDIEAMIKLHQLGSAVLPLPTSCHPNLDGRPRSAKWTDWTAELVLDVHTNGIDPDADAGEIASRLNTKLALRGKGEIDRRDAIKTLRAVLELYPIYDGKPHKT